MNEHHREPRDLAARKVDASLPAPLCAYGYPLVQLQEVLSGRSGEFYEWFVGQTASVCDGSHCREPHHTIVSAGDVERFLRGLPAGD